MTPRYRFFLGGADLEMATIRRLLEERGHAFADKGLVWGAKISTYADDIRAALSRGETPVLIELEDDLPPDAFDRAHTIVVDHHGPRAGADRPGALEQVFALLELPREAWTRELALVAANDKGHIRAMRALGATAEEIRRVREADRLAQGVTPEDETAARAAIARRTVEGRLTRLELPTRRTSAAADFMEPALGGPGYVNLLIETPAGLAFFGESAQALVDESIAGAYSGGALPERGYWGIESTDPAARARLVETIRRLAV